MECTFLNGPPTGFAGITWRTKEGAPKLSSSHHTMRHNQDNLVRMPHRQWVTDTVNSRHATALIDRLAPSRYAMVENFGDRLDDGGLE